MTQQKYSEVFNSLNDEEIVALGNFADYAQSNPGVVQQLPSLPSNINKTMLEQCWSKIARASREHSTSTN